MSLAQLLGRWCKMLPGRLYNVRMSQDDLHSFVQDVYCAQSTAMCCATVLPGRNNSLETERILSRLTLSTSKSSSLLSFQAGALQAAFCTLFYAKVLDLTSETHFRWRDPRLRICLLVQSGTLPKRAQGRVGEAFPTFISCSCITDDLHWQWWHLISLCGTRQKLQKCSSFGG